MYKDGIYLHHGPDNHALAIIREDTGQTIWLRDFVNVEAALNVLEDEVLDQHDREAIEQELARHKGLFTSEIEPREDGYKDHAFTKYVRENL